MNFNNAHYAPPIMRIIRLNNAHYGTLIMRITNMTVVSATITNVGC